MSGKIVLAEVVAAVVVVAGAVALPAIKGAIDASSDRHAVELRNAAYERANPRGVPGAYMPAVDLDEVDETIACLPVQGVVDEAACAAASEARRRFQAAAAPAIVPAPPPALPTLPSPLLSGSALSGADTVSPEQVRRIAQEEAQLAVDDEREREREAAERQRLFGPN